MVSSALHQNVKWHMWLSYLTEFCEKILTNYSQDSGEIEPFAEWPTRYHYLLYAIVDTLVGWIKIVRDLPKDQENVILETSEAIHQNDNIPKTSILALGRCIKLIINSDKLEDKFKKYIIEIVLWLYSDLRAEPELSGYAKALLNTLKAGGYRMMRQDSNYVEKLCSSISSLDKIKYGNEIEEVIEYVKKDG